MTTDIGTCCVCGETADESNSAICNGCYNRYHLRLRNDNDGKDCGDVWINDQYLSLEFACFICLGAPGYSPNEPPVASGH